MSETDLRLWDETAITSQPQWENRAKILAHFIRPSDSVLDLGAGDRKLSKYLSETCNYIPVDCTGKLPGTFVCDFNKEFRLPNQPFDVIISAGFLEYIVDIRGFMDLLSQKCDGKYFLFTIAYSSNKYNQSRNPPKKGYRKLTKFKSLDEVSEFFGQYTRDLRHVLRVRNQSFFSCALSSEPRMGKKLPSIDQAMVRASKLQTWFQRLGKSPASDESFSETL